MVTADQAAHSLADEALRLLRKGLPVFAVCGTRAHMHRDFDGALKPCTDPGKVPLVAWKAYQDRLPTEDEVRSMWRRFPDANIGMATGHLSKIVVLDLDGDLAVHQAQMLGYDNGPHTFTGRVGGVHRYFAYREDEPRNFAHKMGGIDYRGEGGFVLMAGSRHASGRLYVAGEPLDDIDDLPQLPQWVNGLARTASEQPHHTNGYVHTGPPVAEGERNAFLTSVGGGMRYRGADEDEIVVQLRAVNAERCQPPLDDAEVRKIAHSVARYAVEEPRRAVIHGEPDDEEEPVLLGYVPTFPLEVLPDLLQRLIRTSSLPNNLLAGAYLGACATAIGGKVDASHYSFNERVILFTVLMAMTGAGKSPALRQAFAPIVAWDVEKHREYRQEMDAWRNRPPEQKKADKEQGIDPPRDPTILCNNATSEAIYRRLDNQPSLGLFYDELASFLKGLSRYRNRGDDDTDAALTLWDGSPLRYTRVGTGGGGGNAVDIYVPEPTVSICGGLQPSRQDLLGQDLEGLRPRWLVFMHEGLGTGRIDLPDPDDSDAYVALIETLLRQRAVRRRWQITGDAWDVLNQLGKQWEARLGQADDLVSAQTALSKATRHCVRLALVLAETERVLSGLPPNSDALLGGGHLKNAARIVDYSLAAWNALGGGKPIAVTFKAAVADEAIPKILEYIARKGGSEINSNLLRNNRVAGIATKADLDAVLARYEAHYPGTVRYERDGQTKGRRTRFVRLPTRRKEGS